MSVIYKSNGTASWIPQAGDTYLATGKDRSGRRFRIRSASWAHVNGLNLWQGHKWLVRDGKKHLIVTVTN